ncbi:protocadherin Fat 3-like [Ostrea edulis]|uniref:protocadherin Fat 3-like n=1 Tax=Ostrea edulis TaxID=37623 RepID=UPI0024AEBDA3|nr:protocadherin Fat 3-like [Ostrea edulis]
MNSFAFVVINAFVSEADTKGKFVAIVSALDTDSDPVTYSFAGVYPNFRIDSKTGKILLRTSIDRETVPTIDLYVIASDGQRSATATVSVTVEDVNETPIFVNSNYKFTVAENTITGTDIGTVLAVDADVGPGNGQVRYKILFGNDKSYFQIDNTTGQITVATPVDYEDLQTALLVIEASDMGYPTLSGVCIVSIQILDSNDNTPQYIVPLVVSIAVLMVAFIIVAIFIYLVWRRRWCRKKQKKDNAKKPRVQLTETKQEGHNIPLFEKRGQSQVSTKPTSGWDESNSAVSVVSPVPQKSNEEPIREPDIELENSGLAVSPTKKDNAKKPRVQLTETKQEGNNIPLFEKRGQSQVSTKPTSGWDESNSAVSVVSPVPQKSNEEAIREPDIDLENSGLAISPTLVSLNKMVF